MIAFVLLLAAQSAPVAAAPAVHPITAWSRLRSSELNHWFSPDDYPRAALREEAEGLVRFRLSIGPNGRVSECVVTLSAGHDRLDSATCRILKSRLRYASAVEAGGGRTAATDEGWVQWRLPPNRPRSPELTTTTH